MPTELAQRSRWALVFFALSMLAVPALFGGCGRSALDDTLTAFDAGPGDATIDVVVPDATPDAGACTPQTCPNGCCDAAGVCRAGTDLTACGSFGQTCANCPSAGFDFCDVKSHACGRTVPTCNAQSCADGCCDNGLCLSGSDPNECGAGGNACQHCAAKGQACDGVNRVCTGPACGPASCNGCCVGDLCVGGTDPNACGRLGAQCQNCAAQGTSCQPVAPGGVCEGQPTCGPQNCNGCCIGNLCVTGQDQTQCGLAGQQCQNCGAFGAVCQPAPSGGGFCAPTTCGPQNCKTCCQGNTCMPESDVACGIGGGQCFPCPPGSTCNGGICTGQTLCNPQTCPTGCCAGDVCAVGTQDTACGIGGVQCQSCRAFGETCQGQQCAQTCGPQNCAGCCVGNQCVPGGIDIQCGVAGQQCADCAASGLVCRNGLCQTPPPPCDPTSCPGCCDPLSGCVPGFLNAQCGSGGAACTNCNQLGSTCDVSVTPRVCKNQQTTCPAPYGSCPAGVTTAPPTVQHVCTTADLQNARAACAGGPASAGCQQYFQFEQQFNPACATCMQPFDAPFIELTGLFACVAPFVDPQCDHSTGCAIDCQTQSCAQCPPGGATQCRNDVRNNQCSMYFQQSQCVAQALFNSASFCNPNNYGGNFGAWLQGVGGHYCGP